MKVLVATDKPFAKVAVDGIRKEIEAAGYELALLEKYGDKAKLLEAVKDANAIIIRSDIIDAEVLDAAKELKIVVRAGAGYDNVDLAAATAHNVCVMNTPGQNSNAVAELAFGLMVMAVRNMYNGTSGTELTGKKLGIHAYGNVGRNVARIAKGFGMDIYAFDAFCPKEVIEKDGVKAVASAEELYSTCDVVSLHIPATAETKNSINYALVNKMPKGGLLVNTARKEVIDEEGLAKVLAERPDLKYVTDIDEVKGLGFCVSIEHAQFMCRYFNERGIPSIFLTGKSPDEERKAAKRRLVGGDIRFIFVVDIYNEGVDIPEVNTVLFLRPTESLTIFLQQLGRGLRLAEGKECLTVLDFIGQANKRYNFEDKFAALLSNTTCSVVREIKDGFISAPKGCYIQLEKKAAKYILDNIRASYGNTAGLVSRVASFTEDNGRELTLSNFLDYYHLDARAIYKLSSLSGICAGAGVIEDFNEPLEEILTKAFGRLAVIDSRRWLRFF